MLPVFTGTANAAPGAWIRNYPSGKGLDADANWPRPRSVRNRAPARDSRPTFPAQPAFTGIARIAESAATLSARILEGNFASVVET